MDRRSFGACQDSYVVQPSIHRKNKVNSIDGLVEMDLLHEWLERNTLHNVSLETRKDYIYEFLWLAQHLRTVFVKKDLDRVKLRTISDYLKKRRKLI